MYTMQITVKIDGDKVRMVNLVGTQSIPEGYATFEQFRNGCDFRVP